MPAVRAALGAGLSGARLDAGQCRATFRAIRIEKTMMALILLLIVAVAAFNIVAMLVMVVNDKRTDIAILRTFGASPAQHHAGLHDPGHRDRLARRGRGPAARASLLALQRRAPSCRCWSGVRFPVPRCRCLLHHEHSIRGALARGGVDQSPRRCC